jgi:hypothetical protein
MRRTWITAVLAATLLATGGATPVAAQPSGRDFGQHHACVAQRVGLSGAHNPGVHHHGYSNVMGTFTLCPPSEGPREVHGGR